MRQLKGIFFRDWNNDYISEILKEIYWEGIYRPYLKKDAVVLDIGANVGLFSFYCYPQAAKIYAVEPSEEHFDTLMHLLAFNGMEDKIIPIKTAISNKDGKQTFYHSPNTTMYSLSSAVHAPGQETEEVEIMTLESLFKKYSIEHIDLMKVDTEGEEFKIFSSSAFEAVAAKIDTIITEWHSWTNTNPNQLQTMLQDRGYKVERIKTEATMFAATRL